MKRVSIVTRKTLTVPDVVHITFDAEKVTHLIWEPEAKRRPPEEKADTLRVYFVSGEFIRIIGSFEEVDKLIFGADA